MDIFIASLYIVIWAIIVLVSAMENEHFSFFYIIYALLWPLFIPMIMIGALLGVSPASRDSTRRHEVANSKDTPLETIRYLIFD